MFFEAVYAFLIYLRGIKNASDHTIRNYIIDLNALSEFLSVHNKTPLEKIKNDATTWHKTPPSFPLNTISRKTLRSFLTFLKEQGISKRTISRRLS